MAETETADRPMEIRGSKKRKATVPRDREREERFVVGGGGGGGGGGDDDEAKKIEEFFALVRNFREARDRLACSRLAPAAGETGRSDADRREGMKQMKGSVSAWDLRFRREDFMEGAVPMEKATETLAFGSSGSAREGAANNGEEAGLNLKLSL
ncbi:hypothetical protein ACJRO7_009198 [Eucalyptus globulus]|uniref:Uncharacterized protein n=1 Tax=Eucalyptus globulus TaxID=34317 RepID=A0ABD3ITF1_EUCGL